MAAVDKYHFSISHRSRLSSVTLGPCSISGVSAFQDESRLCGIIGFLTKFVEVAAMKIA